ILGHLFTLIEAITDLQSSRPGRLGAEHSLVGRFARRIVGKQPPGGERECLAAPWKRGEVRTGSRNVTKSPIRVSHPYRHRHRDARILLQTLIDGVLDVRCREVHAENYAEDELRRTALGAYQKVVIGGTGNKAVFDPPGEEDAGDN